MSASNSVRSGSRIGPRGRSSVGRARASQARSREAQSNTGRRKWLCAMDRAGWSDYDYPSLSSGFHADVRFLFGPRPPRFPI
jgi:hypothetical protein